MLVLTRKAKQVIVLDGEITLTVLRIQGGTVRIGIQAPADVRILRGEHRESPKSRPSSQAVPDAA